MKTKQCKCGKKMILIDTGTVLISEPPKYKQHWWCKCGHTEVGPIRKAYNIQDFNLDLWESINETEYNNRTSQS